MKLHPCSYTLFRNYEQCPRKTWHINIEKTIPIEQTKEMKWGNKVHSAFERRLNYGDEFPSGIERYEDFCNFPDTYEVEAELKLGMLENGASCDFFHPNVWARGVIDVLCTVPGKPVGLVYFAAGTRSVRLLERERRYGDIGRAQVRRACVLEALVMLRELAEAM